MSKIMGVLAVMLAFVVIIQAYMQMAISANTTGWQPIMTSSVQQYLPLLALVGVIIFVVFAATTFGKKN